MTHALENFNGTISIGGRKITNLRFADDIDGITGEEDELTELVHNLDTAAEKFCIEISAVKTKIMTNNGTLQRDITIQGQKLETVDHFKYLGAIIYNRLYNFLADHNIISKKQYGFRENYSTYMAIIDLVDKISSNIDNKNIVLEYFLTSARPLTQ